MTLFKGKGSALDRENYQALKLTDQVLEVVERVIETIVRECIVICSLVSCLDVGQLILSSLPDNFKENFWTKIKTFILLSLILKRLSIEYTRFFDKQLNFYGQIFGCLS